jgi:hypothetical protein
MVNNVWERLVAGITSILRWNTNMRAMRKHLSGWASHVAGILKTKKLRLSSIIDHLEALDETAISVRD